MAATNVSILNPADKTRMYSVSVGTGAPATGDNIVTNVRDFPLASQYTDKTNKIFYVRTAVAGAATDWTAINPS